MTTINAHFSGKVFVPDEPIDLREGETVELSIRRRLSSLPKDVQLLTRLPLIRLDPDDAEAINRDPSFDVEES